MSGRGLDQELAAAVAERLMAVDPLGSHVRDELGLQPGGLARPLQAAVVSAVSFALGAALPLVLIVGAPIGVRIPVTALAALVLLALLGAVGARLGGASAGRAALRVTIGGGLGDGPDSTDRTVGGCDWPVSPTLASRTSGQDGLRWPPQAGGCRG